MSREKKMSLSVPVQFTKVDGDPHDGTFQKMKVRICSPGKNRNFSYISKDELDAAKPSLAYVPVVGRIYEKTDKDGEVVGYYFGGHDYEVDDNFEWRPTTVPYGVMTVEEPWYETVKEYGKDVEYLCGYCYLWVGRWPELKEAAWDESFWYSQSMEMSFKDYSIYEGDSNFVEFHGCRFDAICILGYDPDSSEYNTTPCFPSAGFVPATEFSLNSTQFSQLMSELKNQLASSFEYTHQNNPEMEGGEGLTIEKNVDMEAAEVTAEQEIADQAISGEVENVELASVETEAAPAAEPASDAGEQNVEMQADEPKQEVTSDEAPVGDATTAEFTLFSMTYREKEEALDEAVSALNSVTKSQDGTVAEEIYCYCMDFDDTHVYYRANRYTAEGYESKTFRCTYVMSDDGKASLTGNAEEVFQKWLTADEIKKIDDEKAQLAELIKFKADIESAETSAKVESMLSEFSDLANLEEFAAIKDEVEKEENPDIANFELRLFALRGKQVSTKVETPAKNVVKVGIDTDEVDPASDGYGGLLMRVHNRNK